MIFSNKLVKLNIGCGTDYKKGWVNIDNNSDNNINKLDLNWDLRNPLPYKDNSIDYIFNEHFLEHLTVDEGQSSLRDFYRVLKSGGVMRIAVPDLDDAVKMYLDKKWKQNPLIKNHDMDFVETNAELLNMSFSWWGHKWLYNWEELERRLMQAGFSNIQKMKHSTSSHRELKNLETRQESTLIAEVVK